MHRQQKIKAAAKRQPCKPWHGGPRRRRRPNASLQSGAPVMAGTMVKPQSRDSSSASAALSVSHHSFAGRMTSLPASSATRPCCCPLTPIAFTLPAVSSQSLPAADRASLIDSLQACGRGTQGC